jgi:hypothetical protein
VDQVVWAEIIPGKWFGYTIVYGRGTRLFSVTEWRWTRQGAEERARLKTEMLQALVDQTRGLHEAH